MSEIVLRVNPAFAVQAPALCQKLVEWLDLFEQTGVLPESNDVVMNPHTRNEVYIDGASPTYIRKLKSILYNPTNRWTVSLGMRGRPRKVPLSYVFDIIR